MYNKIKNYSDSILIFKQLTNITKSYPHYVLKRERNILIINGQLQPTALNNSYKFEIIYNPHKSPIINILNPKIISRTHDEIIPHTYPNNMPCLYYPINNEFTNKMNIGETIIPWLSLWLYYYEIWFVTGEWLGEGIHV